MKIPSSVLFTIVSLFVCLGKFPGYCQGLPMVEPEQVGLSSERLTLIDGYMQSLVEEQQISGVVVLIARGGKTAYFKAFGLMDTEANRPMEKDALFRIASMTKPITCTVAMTLYEEGRFLLNDPVWRYLPEFKDPRVLVLPVSDHQESESYQTIPAEGEIRIRHLLNHTSGISYGSGPHDRIYRDAGLKLGDLASREFTSTGDLVRTLAGLPLLHEPGEKFTYGYSHDVVGYLIEVLAGAPMDVSYRERLFKPLGMKDTDFILSDEKRDRLVSIYRHGEDGKLEKIQEKPENSDSSSEKRIFSGGGGLHSTISDYTRFCQMILNGGELDGVRILSRKTVELMTTNSLGAGYAPFRVVSGDKYGYGLYIRTERGVYDEIESMGTLGGGGGLKTRYWIDPEEQMICILMAQLRGGNWRMHHRFRNLVYRAIID
jgi:CubicO group peptidase (beta-lactamase class C family)